MARLRDLGHSLDVSRSVVSELAAKTSVHVVFAVLIMGGWAAFANRAHGAMPALSAGVVQGGASALVTSTLKTALESLSKQFQGALAYFVPPLVCCAVVLLLLTAVHRLAHTREFWATIAIPYTASSTYAWIYAAILALQRSSTESTAAVGSPVTGGRRCE
jgi:hypothetical protein